MSAVLFGLFFMYIFASDLADHGGGDRILPILGFGVFVWVVVRILRKVF